MNGRFKKLTALLTGLVTVFAGASGTIPQKQQPSITASAANGLLAFPGAVGGGKYATGGRGGTVYHVTNLNDSGAGSFRDAVSQGNRIVVFDVSGTIELKSNVVCQSNITIAGQTAPGGSGITLKNYKFGMGGENVIVRYISSRPGPYNATSSGNDAWGGAAGGNSIIDHCSLGWSSDEQWGLYSKNDNYTCQYTVIGPANSWGGHDKGIHGFGIMFGRANFTFDHNLIIHNVSRNFRGKVTDQNAADFTNNIIYDWGYQTTYGTIGHVNYVNNTLKRGNSTVSGIHYASVSDNDNFKLYLTGNRILNKDNTVANAENNNWSAIGYNGSKNQSTTESSAHFPIMINGEDVSTSITCESAADSYEHVIQYVGNGISPDKRTAIDKQCAEETKNGTGSCSGTAAYDSSVSDLTKYKIECGVTYNYPSAVLTKEITDADNDGMADDWELARGLDPTDPNDYKEDYLGQGYMNIEYYINDLTVDSFPPGVVECSPENAVDPISAFETIEAETFSTTNGVRAEDNASASGGQNVGFVTDGSYMMFRKVDFGDGARSFKATLSGNAAGIEFYIGSISGTPAATVSFPGTSGFADYQEFEFTIPKISGTGNLYLKFTGGEGYLLNIDKFVFGKDAVPLNGKLLKNVSVSDGANPALWAFGYDFAAGSLIFGDREFTVTQLSDELAGAEVLKTSCDAKTSTGTTATLEAAEAITLYIAVDTRVENTPSWLADYTKTDLIFLSSNDVTFVIYKADFKQGDKITLGSNEQSAGCVNFTVLAKAAGSTDPGPGPEPEHVFGDINGDGSLNIADLVLMQKYILATDTLTPEQAENADLIEDGIINIFDMIALRVALVETF